MVLTMIGASLLWVGWFGFNAGSAVSAGMQAGMAMTVTHLATATAGFTWMIVEWIMRGKPTVHRHLLRRRRRARRHHAGLRLCRPDGGFLPSASPPASSAIGAVTGLKHMFGYDDALDAFGVHAVGGATGALLTGVFAVSDIWRHRRTDRGQCRPGLNQAIGIGCVFVYDVVVTLIILKVVDLAIGLRVSEDVERDGLDLALHGETVQ